jgi:hypothetical protein
MLAVRGPSSPLRFSSSQSRQTNEIFSIAIQVIECFGRPRSKQFADVDALKSAVSPRGWFESSPISAGEDWPGGQQAFSVKVPLL